MCRSVAMQSRSVAAPWSLVQERRVVRGEGTTATTHFLLLVPPPATTTTTTRTYSLGLVTVSCFLLLTYLLHSRPSPPHSHSLPRPSDMSQQIIIEALSKHTATIIFSHGLGDTAAGWAPFAASLKGRFPHIKWILPTAPNSPVTLNGGMAMPSWFDIRSLTPPTPRSPSMEDEAGMLRSARRLSDLVAREVENGIPASRIVVGGFSQGELPIPYS